MPPNKNRHSKQKQAKLDEPSPEAPTNQNNPKLTENQEHNKDIFIEIEPTDNTDLVVTGQSIQEQQQVDQFAGGNQQTSNHLDQQELTALQNASLNANDVEDETSLSATVTRLSTSNGAEVFLIGTAHFSPQSVQDVQKVIRAIKPSSVILELCRERAFMLSLDEESLLEQNRKLSFEKVRNAIAEKGVAQGLIYIMFIKMSASLTEKLGLAPGAEFRAGSAEAQKIPGCSVVLGDRSLKVTVARAVASVSLWQKIKLIYQVLINDVTITQEDVEKCKDKDILEQLLQELGGEFPGFKRVLLDERNIYLAHSIYRWAQNTETSIGPQRVVAIVGIGHVSGIVENWGKTTDDQIRLLNEIPEASRTRRIVGKTIKYCTIALLVYVGYRTIIPSSVQTAIHSKLTGH